MMIVVVDNTVDSRKFCENVLAFLAACSVPRQCVRHLSEALSIPRHTIHGFILTGSSMHLHEMDEDRRLLNTLAMDSGKPVLGICLGAQILLTHLQGRLVKMPSMLCGAADVRRVRDNEPILENMPASFKAKFCARFVPSSRRVPPDVVPLCTAKLTGVQQRVVAFRHSTRPIYGCMFHPEDRPETHTILRNFVHYSGGLRASWTPSRKGRTQHVFLVNS